MLFYITTELVTLAQFDDKALRVLNNLALSRLDGVNIILAEKENLDTLRKMEKLDDSARRVFHEAFLKLPSLYSILELIDMHFYVTVEENAILKKDNKRIIKIPYFELNKRSLFNGASVLLENFNEKFFYDHITDWYRKTKKLSSINYKYALLNGGGDCISSYFSYLQDSKEIFCLAIADSDLKYPNGSFGQTASRLKKVPKNGYLCDYMIINVRECENLAPLYILKETCKGDPNWEKAFIDIEKVNNTNADCLLFIDYKKGLREKNLHSYKDTELNTYLKNILRDSKLLSEEEFQSIKERPEESFDEKNEFIIHPFGNNILERIVEQLNWKSQQNIVITEINPESLIVEWERIGSTILNWSCSLPHIA